MVQKRLTVRGLRSVVPVLTGLLLSACSLGPSISANSFVVHVVAEDCRSASVGPVLIEYETIKKANNRAAGDVTGWVTLQDHGCEEIKLAATVNHTDTGTGTGTGDPQTVNNTIAVRVLRSSHNWTRDQPFTVQLGHNLNNTRFAVPSDSRLRIDFTHILAGVIVPNPNSDTPPTWIAANQWPPAVTALTDRQDCEGIHIDRQDQTNLCLNWRDADLHTFKASGSNQD